MIHSSTAIAFGLLIVAQHQNFAIVGGFAVGRNCRIGSFSLRLDASDSSQNVVEAFIPRKYTREDAQSILDDKLMPRKDYGERIGWGRDAQSFDETTGPLNPSDPRLSQTYGEFPLRSMDELIDRGLEHLPASKRNAKKLSLLDIGSGCGRLVFYSAMVRGSNEEPSWDVHGIEISDELHNRALDFLKAGAKMNLMTTEEPSSCHSNMLTLNCGPAEEHKDLLEKADIVFSYSTTFPAKAFSPEVSALLLDPEWSELLGSTCSAGCVAITTDRALDPAYSWELLDRLDVENPEVYGTTGYIHILRE